MIVTSLPSTHTISSTRATIMPNKTCSSTKVETSKSLRLIASNPRSHQPSSTRSSPHVSKNTSSLRSSSPLKKETTTQSAAKVSSHNLRQQPSNRPIQAKKKKPAVISVNKIKNTPVLIPNANDKNDRKISHNDIMRLPSAAPYDDMENAVVSPTHLSSLEIKTTGAIGNTPFDECQDQCQITQPHQVTPTQGYTKTLEAQLEIATADLYYERELVHSMKLEMQQLKEEIIRLKASHSNKSNDTDNEVLRTILAQSQKDLNETTKTQQEWISRCRMLEQENDILKATQRQTESECLRLMDELLVIEKADNVVTTEGMDETMYRREIEQMKLELKREKQRYNDLEETYQEKVEKFNRDMYELESLVESKVFKETDLEASLSAEREKIEALEAKLKEEQEKNSMTHLSLDRGPRSLSVITDIGILNRTNDDYCEICEEHGHDVITCKALNQDEMGISPRSCYCINCDIFDLHTSEECPNQDETF